MSPPVLAAIGHLSDVAAYQGALAALRGDDLPPPRAEDVARVLSRLSPMPICPVTVRSIRGTTIDAVYVDAFLLVDGGGALRHLSKVQRACAAAATAGAKLATLGGFTSIIGESARWDPDAELGLAFTTGNTLTAAVLGAQVRALAAPGATVAVVGAAGDVGSGLCRILHAQGDRLLAVGRDPQRLAALVAALPGAEALAWADAAPRADVVVLVASTGPGGIPVDRVRRDAVVLDAGHPPNAAGGPARVGGRVRFAIPTESPLPAFTSHGCAPGEHHACLAEGAALALDGRFEPFSRGRGAIFPDRAAEILEIAARHGLSPAPV